MHHRIDLLTYHRDEFVFGVLGWTAAKTFNKVADYLLTVITVAGCTDLPYIHILYIYWCLSEPQALRQYANRKGFSLSDHALVPIRNSAAGRGHDKVSDVVSSSQRVHQSKPSLLS